MSNEAFMRAHLPGPDSTAEDLNRLAEQGFVFDHQYMGNICGGFGGKTECKKIDYVNGGRCGKSPFYHHYIKPRHSAGGLELDCERTPKHYRGRHLPPDMLVVDGWVQYSGRYPQKRCPGCDRRVMLTNNELLSALPEHEMLTMPCCGCRVFAYYLRQKWGVENCSGDPR